MRFADRKSWRRIVLILIVFVAAGWGTGLYMCRCACKGKKMIEPVKVSAETLKAHVEMLASDIGERNVFRSNELHRAAAYIEQQWRKQGYAVTRHPYKAYEVECANIEVTRG